MARKWFECYVNIIRNILIISIIVIVFCVYEVRKQHQNEVASHIPKDALKYIFFEKKSLNHPKSIPITLRFIFSHNQQEKILNEEMYGPIEKDTVVFVLTVHKLSIYLEFLIFSLSQVRGIEKTFIIFSHSYFDDNINDLIQSIDFARVMQIYYPYSVQMYPNKFPGLHPLDCPHYINMQDAEAMNCTGASFPDVHGHYRDPTQSETKHHWWWTANTVFEMLSRTNNHTGTVIFLKDDIFLLQDFMFMIVSMTNMAEFLPNYDFMSLDTISDVSKFNPYRIDIKKWVPTDYPDVLGFSVTTWNSIASHYDLFCSVDDYSWAKSLFYISLNRRDAIGQPYIVISTATTRAFKTSKCGFNRQFVDCDAIESVFQVLNLQEQIIDELFPAYFQTFTLIELPDEHDASAYTERNGGWNDPRDKKMCETFTKKTSKTTVDKKKVDSV